MIEPTLYTASNLAQVPGPFIVRPQTGLGDSVLCRAAVRELAKVRRDFWIRTPWPFLFDDLGARGILASDDPHVRAIFGQHPGALAVAPDGTKEYVLSSAVRVFEITIARRSMLDVLLADVGAIAGDCSIDPARFEEDGRRDFARAGVDPERPFVAVRYPTLTNRWSSGSRNPAPGTVAIAAAAARRGGEVIISLGNVDGMREWFTESAIDRPADVRLERGELSVPAYLWAIARARAMITCVCNSTLLGPALGTSTLAVFGGCMPPVSVCDPRIGPGLLASVAPEPFCACFDPQHDCPRAIPAQRLVDAARALP